MVPGQRDSSRVRGSRNYEKPPMPIGELVDRLHSRGLVIPDRARATRYVRHIGYFRLSPYTIPFRRDPASDELKRSTAFDDVLDLYIFDRSLRLLVLDAIERVEVAVRTALTDHMSTKYYDPHWYLDPSHFRVVSRHGRLLQIVERTCDAQLQGTAESVEDALTHRSALEHYLVTYGNPALPPSWLMVETLTLGQLHAVYSNLRDQRDRTAIAKVLGLTAPVLESWLKTYVRVRNVCAHHGRLWNLGLGVYPVIPTSRSVSWLKGQNSLPMRSQKRLYPVLVSLQSVLDTISPHSSWARRMHQLLSTRPRMNLVGMGIPADWANDEFWRGHVAEPDADALRKRMRKVASRPRLSRNRHLRH